MTTPQQKRARYPSLSATRDIFPLASTVVWAMLTLTEDMTGGTGESKQESLFIY